MPENSVLSNIDLGKIDGGLDIIAITKDNNTATQVQLNLSDPSNKLFEKVDIVSINCDPNVVPDAYPCKVNLRALFSKDSSFKANFQQQKKVNQ